METCEDKLDLSFPKAERPDKRMERRGSIKALEALLRP